MTAYLAAAIALLGASIAWGQWHTARQKLILDLFEKRLTIIEVVWDAWREFNEALNSSFSEFDEAAWHSRLQVQRRRAVLLFGDEYEKLISRFIYQTSLIRSDLSERGYDTDDASEEAARAERLERRKWFYRFPDELYSAAIPYVKMDQKLPVHLSFLTDE
ncbi:hypothetical protein [Jiella pacifica]|uniref:Uncharacterized protein n=1 Tax=Jiella pacifica TaxID=2696469 RepID=A0A6N9TD81_9HYPH|nr:hypothetical protein [Jiella pacifica]NDW08036.1 hypothetical protein [Jiella pacifica]